MRELIGEDLYLIPGRRKGRYPHCNSLLLGGDKLAVFDPASDRKELGLVAEGGPAAVLVSHYHTDHMRYLKLFTGTDIHIHEVEARALEDFDHVLGYVFFPEEEGQEKWKERKLREVGGWGYRVTHTFTDGDVIRFGDYEVQIVHTPGHTPGHSCFWFPAQEVLYSADFDFTSFGPWYGNSASSVDDFLESIDKLRAYRPKITVTAHETGLIEGDISGKLDTFERVIRDRESRLLEHLREPLTVQQLTDKAVIYGKHYSSDNFTADVERRMVRHHLASAMRRGLVRKEGEKFSLV